MDWRRRRYLALGAAALAAVCIVWGALWWFGRAEVLSRADLEVARLEARGWAVTWDGRAVGGFPFGYELIFDEVAATHRDSGLLLRLPELRLSPDEDDPSRLVARLPDRLTLDLPVAETMRGGGTDLPKVLRLTGEADGLSVTVAGAGPTDRALDVVAESLVWRVDQPDLSATAALTLQGLDAGLVRAGEGATARLQATLLGLDIAAPEGGEVTTLQASLRDTALTARSEVGTAAALAEMLYAGAPGRLEVALQTGGAEVGVEVAADAMAAGGGAGGDASAAAAGDGGDAVPTHGRLGWRAATASAVATLTSGRMELQGESRQNAWTVAPEDQQVPFRGTVTAGLVQGRYAMPMAPRPEPEDMAIRLALLDVEADETAWEVLDPDAALDRAPAELVIDLAGTVRVLKRIDRMQPGEAPPFEVSNLMVREVAVEALGASAEATGDIEMLQPINLPLGKIEVALTGAAALIGALERSGLLPPEMIEMAEAMLVVYARPGEGPDAWETDITFGNEGITVNEMPVR